MPAVRSVEPSSTTTMSKPGSNARISSITRPTVCSSFRAGTIASRLSSPSRASTASRGRAGASASSAMRGHGRSDFDELEDLARAMRIRVLVEHPLASTPPHRLGRTRVVQELAVGGQRFVGRRDDPHLRAGLEPALDSVVRIGDDRRARGCKLEGPARRGCENGRVRAPRDVQVDACAGDRLRKDVEGNITDQPRIAQITPKISAAERKVDLRIAPTRLADERLHPLTPELVSVAVEEHVVLL